MRSWCYCITFPWGLSHASHAPGIILSGIDKPDGSASNPCCSARVDRSGAGIALKRIRLRVTELYLFAREADGLASEPAVAHLPETLVVRKPRATEPQHGSYRVENEQHDRKRIAEQRAVVDEEQRHGSVRHGRIRQEVHRYLPCRHEDGQPEARPLDEHRG